MTWSYNHNQVQIKVWVLLENNIRLINNLYKDNPNISVGEETGIQIWDSECNIYNDKVPVTFIGPESDIFISQFTSKLTSSTISGQVFQDSKYIRVYASDFIRIHNNEFKHPSGVSNTTVHDIWLESSDAFYIHDNIFDGYFNRNTSFPSSASVAIQNCGTFGNELNKNKFYHYPQGVSTIGDNSGLTFRCNDFINQNRDDIQVLSGSIRKLQGLCDPLTNTFDPAGNTFSHVCYNTESDFHQYINAPNVQYNYHNNTYPICFSSSVSANDCNLALNMGPIVEFDCKPRIAPFVVNDLLNDISTINTKISLLNQVSFPNIIDEDKIDYFVKEKQLLENNLLLTWATAGNKTAIINYLQNRTDWYAQWRLMNFYVEIGQFEKANILAISAKQNFSADIEIQAMCDFIIASGNVLQAKFNPNVNRANTPELERIAASNLFVSDRANVLLEILETFEDQEQLYKTSPKNNVQNKIDADIILGTYPNPFSDYITLHLSNKTSENKVITIKLTDLLGTTVYSENISLSSGSKTYHNLNFNQMNIRKSVYFVQIFEGSRLIDSKLMQKI